MNIHTKHYCFNYNFSGSNHNFKINSNLALYLFTKLIMKSETEWMIVHLLQFIGSIIYCTRL